MGFPERKGNKEHSGNFLRVWKNTLPLHDGWPYEPCHIGLRFNHKNGLHEPRKLWELIVQFLKCLPLSMPRVYMCLTLRNVRSLARLRCEEGCYPGNEGGERDVVCVTRESSDRNDDLGSSGNFRVTFVARIFPRGVLSRKV